MAPVTKPSQEKYDVVFLGGGSGGVAGSVSRIHTHDYSSSQLIYTFNSVGLHHTERRLLL